MHHNTGTVPIGSVVPQQATTRNSTNLRALKEVETLDNELSVLPGMIGTEESRIWSVNGGGIEEGGEGIKEVLDSWSWGEREVPENVDEYGWSEDGWWKVGVEWKGAGMRGVAGEWERCLL